MSEGNRHDEIQGEIIHVYDGIEEADNELPTWWLITFYGAIVFAVGYWFYFHGFGVGALPMQRYAMERAAAASAGGEVSDELILALADDPSAVTAGRDSFAANCAVCHREDAAGNIGPNLTDPYWIHGGSALNIHDTIRDGVTTSGMPAWGATLGPTAVQQLAAYVVTLRDTNVEGKEAQGDRWDPNAAAQADAPAEDAQGSTEEAEATAPVEAAEPVEAADSAEPEAEAPTAE